MMRGLLSKHSYGKKEGYADTGWGQIPNRRFNVDMSVRLWSHLTEEHEHAHVELQQSGDAERPSLRAAQRIKQQLSAQRALSLLRPHINLLLAVRKRTVLPVLALLTFLYLCGTKSGRMLAFKHNTGQFRNLAVAISSFFFFHLKQSSSLFKKPTHLYRVQMPRGSYSAQAWDESSSRWGHLCFWDDTAAHLSYSGELPLADTCSPSLVDLKAWRGSPIIQNQKGLPPF